MSFILTAAETRAAEQRAMANGTSAEILMDRAGTAAAEAIWRFAGPLPALILCGPGNNGGDGFVVAGELARRGVDVRVAALAEPATETTRWARTQWHGSVGSLAEAEPAPLLVDALFGTGLGRPLDGAAAASLARLAANASATVAIDLPSGVASDDGRILSPVPDCDLTITFASLKPAHLLQPAARHMGRIVVADIGVDAHSALRILERPRLSGPGPDDHKYRRGYVAILAGPMPGAAALAASAAARAGGGYVRLIAPAPIAGIPQAIVQSPGGAAEHLGDPRIGAVAVGPGLGRGGEGRALLAEALASGRNLVLDADALTLLAGTPLHLPADAILTPHAGEFERLFGTPAGSKVEQAREAARRSGAVIVSKGADTVIAAPDGRAALARPAPHWLASAGTGDVLTGIVAAMRARGLDAFDAACAGVWLHGEAARLAGPALIADDLLHRLAHALAGPAPAGR
ncbi:MAG TPA: NAD(P)H-hydrate dehydratase [Allosphingosinicella sp.]|jgi:hydroxyethylthiazole kinase-like uncharacterized protein yjeF